MSDLISLQDAARQLGTNEKTLRRYVALGRLDSERRPGSRAMWLRSSQLASLDPRSPGRPRQAQVSRERAVAAVLIELERWPPAAQRQFCVTAASEAAGLDAQPGPHDLIQYFATHTTDRGPWGQTVEVAILSQVGLSMDRIAVRMNMSKTTVQNRVTLWHVFPAQRRAPAQRRLQGLDAHLAAAEGGSRFRRERTKYGAANSGMWREDEWTPLADWYPPPDDYEIDDGIEDDIEDDPPQTAKEAAVEAATRARYEASYSVCRCSGIDLEMVHEDADLYGERHLQEAGWRDDGVTRVLRCPDFGYLWLQSWQGASAEGYGPSRLKKWTTAWARRV